MSQNLDALDLLLKSPPSGAVPPTPAPTSRKDKVFQKADEIGVPRDLVDRLVTTESRWNHHDGAGRVLRSPKNAMGLFQVVPDRGTMRTVGGRQYDLNDEDQNTEAGLRYIKEGLDKSGGDPHLASLYYFGGPGALAKAQRTGRIPNISDGGNTASSYVKSVGGSSRPTPTVKPLATSAAQPDALDLLFQSPAQQPPAAADGSAPAEAKVLIPDKHAPGGQIRVKAATARAVGAVSPTGLQTAPDPNPVVTAQNPSEIQGLASKPQQITPDQPGPVTGVPPVIAKEALIQPESDSLTVQQPVMPPPTYNEQDKRYTGNVGRIMESGPQATEAYTQFLQRNVPHVKGKAVAADSLVDNEPLATVFTNLQDYFTRNPKAKPKEQARAIAQMGKDWLADPNTNGMQMPTILHQAMLSAHWTPEEIQILPSALRSQIQQRQAQARTARRAAPPGPRFKVTPDSMGDVTAGAGGGVEGVLPETGSAPSLAGIMPGAEARIAKESRQAARNAPSGVGGLRKIDDPQVQFMQTLEREKNRTVFPGDPSTPARLKAAGMKQDDIAEFQHQQKEAQKAAQATALIDFAFQQSSVTQIVNVLPKDAKTWVEETFAKGGSQMLSTAAGLIKNGVPAIAVARAFGAPDPVLKPASRALAYTAGVMNDATASMDKTSGRSEMSQEIQDLAAGTLGSAPAMALIALGVPAWAAFGIQSSAQAQGADKKFSDIVHDTAKGATIGALFDLPLPAKMSLLTRLGARVSSVGAGTFGIEKLDGASTKDAFHAAAINAILSGAGEGTGILKKGAETVARAEVTPEWLRDKVAKAGGLDRAVVLDTDGRAISMYADPKTQGMGGEEVSAEKADKYAKRGAEDMPVLRVTPEEYDQVKDLIKSKAPKPGEKITKTITGETEATNAVQVREPAPADVVAAPGDSEAVGARVPGSGQVADARSGAESSQGVQKQVPLQSETAVVAPKDVIEQAGMQYLGEQQMLKGKPSQHVFNDPQTGSTLMMPAGEVTPEGVKAKVEASRAKVKPAQVEQASQPAQTIYTPNKPFDWVMPDIVEEMKQRGSPTVRAVWSEKDQAWRAVEGSHQIAAAKQLGLPVKIELVGPDTVIENHDIESLKGKPATAQQILDALPEQYKQEGVLTASASPPVASPLVSEGAKERPVYDRLLSTDEPAKEITVRNSQGKNVVLSPDAAWMFDLGRNGNISLDTITEAPYNWPKDRATAALLEMELKDAANALPGRSFRVTAESLSPTQGEAKVEPKPAPDALDSLLAGVGKEAVEPKPTGVTFTTAKGSEYIVHEDGSTSRNKAKRTEHLDSGPQPRSQKTYYVTSENAEKLGEIQAIGKWDRSVKDRGDGTLGMYHETGPSAGKYEGRTVVPFETEPREGLTPVEIWKDGRGAKNVHFGNEITEVRGQKEDVTHGRQPKEVSADAMPAGASLTEASRSGSIIYFEFDAMKPVPTKEQMKNALRAEGISAEVIRYAPGLVSGARGTVRFRADVMDEHGRMSEKAAEKIYKRVFGTSERISGSTTLEGKLTFAERFKFGVDVAKARDLGTPIEDPRGKPNDKLKTKEVQSISPAADASDKEAAGSAGPTPDAVAKRSGVRQAGGKSGATGQSSGGTDKSGKEEKVSRPKDVNQTSPAFQAWWEKQGPRGRDAIRAYLETGSTGQAVGAWKDAASGVKMNDKAIKAAVNNLVEETNRRLSSEAGAVNFGEIYGVVSNLIQRARDQLTIDPVPGLKRLGVSAEARQHAAARVAVPYVVRSLLSEVFPDEYADPEMMALTMDAINKDNIRGGYDTFLKNAREASAGQDTDMAQFWQDRADAVGDVHDIEQLDKDLIAVKENPRIMANIDRWVERVNPEIDRMYNEMKRVDPDTPREGRGYYFGARVNLLPEARAAEMKNFADLSQPMPEGVSSNYRNPNVKKDKFMKLARFTGQYSTDAEAVLTNVIGPRLNETTKLRLYDALTDSGAAVELDYGETPPAEIQGHKAVRLPIKVPETGEGGLTRLVEKALYVRADVAREVRDVLNTDMPLPQNKMARWLTTIQLAQLTDMTAHLKNIHTVLAAAPGTRSAFTDAMRRLPILGSVDSIARIVNVTRGIIADTPASRAEQASMARLGLLRPEYPLTGLQKITRGQQVIHHVDTASRIVMNRFFDNLVAAGRVVNSEENRASFVQQIGEYNRRLMGPIMRAARDAGFAPFVVAGRNYNRQARRLLTGNPGVEASTLGEASKMRLVNILAGLVAASVLPAILNLLTTGNLGGRPGTPIGAWDLGYDPDEQGRHRVIDLMQIVGIRRGLRGTGTNAVIEGIREGQTWDEIIGHAGQDVTSTLSHPWMGPALGFAYQTITGKRLDLRGGPEAPEALNVGGGGKQYIENARTALENQNPLLAGVLSPLTDPYESEDSYPERIGKGLIKGPTSAFGVYDLQSPAQKVLSEDRRRRGAFSKTADQMQARDLKAKLHEDERAGKNVSEALEQAVAEGKLTLRQAHDFKANSGMTPLAMQIKYASLEASVRAFEVMDDKQKSETREALALKFQSAKPESITRETRDRADKLGFKFPDELEIKDAIKKYGPTINSEAMSDARRLRDQRDAAFRSKNEAAEKALNSEISNRINADPAFMSAYRLLGILKTKAPSALTSESEKALKGLEVRAPVMSGKPSRVSEERREALKKEKTKKAIKNYIKPEAPKYAHAQSDSKPRYQVTPR